jgi:integration host factor subunit beta
MQHDAHPGTDGADDFEPRGALSGQMTRSELIARLAERYPQLVLKDAEFAVRTILEAMAHTLADGHRIEIRGFGSFALSHRPPRVGRNPKSGEKVLVPGKRVPHFKPGKELREKVDLALRSGSDRASTTTTLEHPRR